MKRHFFRISLSPLCPRAFRGPILAGVLCLPGFAAEAPPRVSAWHADAVEIAERQGRVAVGEQAGSWTLMAIVRGETADGVAVFEDFTSVNGEVLLVDRSGTARRYGKTAEPTSAEPASLYRGHALDEVLRSDHDLLGDELLAQPGDPNYESVASCLAPILKLDPHNFVGTTPIADKVGVAYGGRTSNFDPAVYVPAIRRIRDEHQVLCGLVGGWLPALRFVYPEAPGDWTEMVMFAPLRTDNENPRVQPVWYRVCRVEGNRLAWVKYVDSYFPVPPRAAPPAADFYSDFAAFHAGWEKALAGAMTVELPEARFANLSRHSLVRAMMTRVGAFPKYGVLDRNYGSAEHDGFPDTFNVDVTAMLGWGLNRVAGDYVDNFLTYFVRDDGSLVYRGPETGQYGRMLTVLAEYARLTGDDALLLKHHRRIAAIAHLLLALRAEALQRPVGDPAHGMIAGWCEADSCLEAAPSRYVLPYLSNSAEAARGWAELGAEWQRIGRARKDAALVAEGDRLVAEAKAQVADLDRAVNQSRLSRPDGTWIPAVAGAPELPHEAAAKDSADPQFRAYRTYMELLFSGLLSRDQVDVIRRYRSTHRDQILGVPTAYGYNSSELVGFLSYGHGFGLLQHDFIREYILELYSLAAHQYTRGQWMAPETRLTSVDRTAAPYCVPAQLAVPLLVQWMLVFEDPRDRSLALARGVPREWLAAGKVVAVNEAPTRWGRVSYRMTSHLDAGRIDITLQLPERPAGQVTTLRLRAPGERRLHAVELNGQPLAAFNGDAETITIPEGKSGTMTIVAHYQ